MVVREHGTNGADPLRLDRGDHFPERRTHDFLELGARNGDVDDSRLLGFGAGYVLRRHLLPALAPVLGTLLAFSAAQAVLALAALGFIGVGLQPPTPELGLMMTEFLPHYEEAPWLIAAPVALLMAVVLGMMLVAGDGETT